MKALENLSEAIEMYYSNQELLNADIKKLFGVKSSSKVASLKRPVLDEMNRRGIPRWNPSAINTEVAFAVWGFDIKDLERKYKKLMELKINSIKE